MATSWPSARHWRRIGIGTLLLLVAIAIGLRLFAMSPMARNMVESRLEAASFRGQTIELDRLSGDLLGNMSIASLKVSDANGVWLTASEVDLGWRPFALFNDHLHLTELSAQHIDIVRRPIVTPSSDGGGGLARYTLAVLDLPDISLANGVAGPAQSYMVTGAVQANRSQGAIQFDLTTTSQRGDDVRADLTWGGAIPLDGTVSLSGAPNGLVATFLDAPTDAAVKLEMESSEDEGDWRLQADGTVADTQILAVDLEISEQTYRIEGTVALDALGVMAPLRARLGDQFQFTANVDTDNALTASARADSFSAELSAIARPSLQGVTLEGVTLTASEIDAERLSGLPSVSLSRFSADGDLFISPNRINFDGALSAPNVSYSDYNAIALKTDGDWTISDDAFIAEMRIEATSLSGLPESLATLFRGPVSARVSGEYDRRNEQIRARTLLLESGSLWALGNGSATRSGAVSFNGEARVTNMDPISSLQTKWTLTGGSLNALRLKLTGVANLADRLSTFADTVGTTFDFDITAQRDENGVAIPSASLSSDKLQANASGNLDQEMLNIQGNVDLPVLALAGGSAEAVSTDFSFNGPVASAMFTSETRAQNAQISGQTLNAPVLTTNILLTPETTFDVRAEAGLLASPLQLSLQGRRQDNRLEVDSLAADWANLTAVGGAVLDTQALKESTIALNVSGTTPLGGVVAANVDYGSERLDADIGLSDIEFGTLDISKSRLQMAGAWPEFEGALTYQAELPILGTPQQIAGSHDLISNMEARTLSLTGAANFADQTVSVSSPLVLSFAPNLGVKGAVSGFGGSAEIELDGSGQTQSSLAFDGIQMATIGPLLNRPSLTGSMAGAFDIALIDAALTGKGIARIEDLSRDAVDAASTDLVLNVGVENNQLSANLRTEDDNSELNFSVEASAALAHEGTILSARLADGAPVPVSIRGTGAIGPIWALAAPSNLRLVGDLMVDINNATGESWRFEGPLSLEGGTFEDGLTGLHLKDISADALLRPNGIEVQSARASGRRSGTVEAAGLYHFDGAGSVVMSLDRLNAFSRSDVSVTVSGRTEIERQNRRTQVAGDLEIDEARINLEQLPGAGYTTLDVDFEDDANTNRDATPEREAIELNLNVDADRRIFMTGSGVETEWGLDARVTGSAGRPNVIGRATLIRGEADLLSRRFRFSDGTIQFVGDPLDSVINIRADRTEDDVTASITLSGSIDDPDIALSSDPSLPDDEVLSRVLFGRSPSELSALEAAQLAGAAAQLAGSGGFNLVGQLQEATGLDRLSIGLDDQGAATVSTGKYIAKDIYLEIETGGTGAPGVALEWTPLDNVAVDAEVDPELGPKVAVQWKRDFDRLPGEPDDD